MSKVHFPIHHTFGPLVTQRQWKKAWKLQLRFSRWQKGPEIEKLRSELSHSFGMSAALFGSCRDALLSVLRTLNLSPGDEVIVQGYTCLVVPNAIHAAQGTPVFADIDPQTLNIDIQKIQTCITPRTKAIICQHTFGIPVDTKKLRSICDKRGLLLIEDCAHIIPDGGSTEQTSFIQSPTATEGIGLHGDVVLLSFGRDKVVSGTTGGAALTRHPEIARALAKDENEAAQYSKWQILNLIGYPLRYHFAKWLWRLPGGSNIAKAYLRWAQLMKLLPPVYTKSEKEGKADLRYKKLPNACAILILDQLASLSEFNEHRRKLATFYYQMAKAGDWDYPTGIASSIAPLKFPVYVRQAEKLRRILKREQIYLDDGWCNTVIHPGSAKGDASGYPLGACPVAEDVAQHVVNLPTHPTMTEEQAKYLVHALRSYLG
jgi:dTDP-4-amino-4,6-dideoxygalactose transaminase